MITTKPKKIKIKWLVEGQPDFCFGEDKKMYKISTQRQIKIVLNGYTRGWYLNRKFFSQKQIKPLLRIIE